MEKGKEKEKEGKRRKMGTERRKGDNGKGSRRRTDTVLEGVKDPLFNQFCRLAFSTNCTEGRFEQVPVSHKL